MNTSKLRPATSRLAAARLPVLFAAFVGITAGFVSQAAHAEAGARLCSLNYEVSGRGSVGKDGYVSGSAGMASKVGKGDNRACTAKLNWMDTEIRRINVRAVALHAGVSANLLDWSKAEIKGPGTSRLATCEDFSKTFRMPKKDMCKAIPMGWGNYYTYYSRFDGNGGNMRWYQ